ncbi:MAG: M3 family metallopeptidase, partial [Planctomycetaceae bacterium]
MSHSPADVANNPLLVTDGLPRFDRIEPEHVVPAVRHVLAAAQQKIEHLEANLEPTWAGVMRPLDAIGRPFEYAWGPVSHLMGVKNSPELRAAHEAVLGDVVSFSLRVRQSEPVYRAVKQIREGAEWNRLDEPQQRIIEQKLLNVELSGIGLQGEQRERFNAIERELSQLSTDFSNHVLDATKAWSLIVTDAADAEGLPESFRRLAAQ